jgi:hypothetical protein
VGIACSIAILSTVTASPAFAAQRTTTATTTTTIPVNPPVTGEFQNFTVKGVTSDYYQPPSPTVGIHMVLLNTGDVLVLGAFRYNYAPWPGTAYVWNPRPGAPNNGFVKEVDPPDNIFCSGVAFFSDGTVVLTGGRLHGVKFAGPPLTYTFDPVSMTWQKQPNIPFGRFYPTETELSNGEVVSGSGGTETGWYNKTLDVVSPGTPSVHIHSTPPIVDYEEFYPRQWLMPDGNIAVYENKRGYVINTANPDPDLWTTTPMPNSTFYHSGFGPASVLLPGGPTAATGPSKMLLIGGSGDSGGYCTVKSQCDNNGTGTVEELDYSNLAAGWTTLAHMPGPGRNHANAVLLPDGNVFLAGGNTVNSWNQPQHQELLYNPSTNRWTGLASNDPNIQRGYHSNAILLPSGRVLIGGDTGGEVVNGTTINDHGGRLEVYDPPYLFKGTRPVITSAPSTVTWGSTFQVASSPDVTSAVLMAPAAQTHSVDMNQRSIDLPVTTTSTGVSLTAPVQSVAPPGYYMLFLLNSRGVPSVAAWIHVGGIAPVVTSLSTNTGGPYSGGTQVVIHGSGFTNAVGVKFGATGASFTVNSDSQITATSPVPVSGQAVGAVDVTVETLTAQSAAVPADRFLYGGPDVTKLSPAYGPEVGGTSVTIQGVNFASGDVVRFGTVAASNVSVTSPTALQAVAPAGTGLVNVSVTAPNGHANPSVVGVTQFNYEPSVDNGRLVDGPLALNPAYGPSQGGGSPIVISGSNFNEATGVYFGPEPAQSFTIVSDTEIEAVPPPAPSYESYADVTVRAKGGTSSRNELDDFCWYNPALGQTHANCTNAVVDYNND